jgi:nucleoid DNA-binding protein
MTNKENKLVAKVVDSACMDQEEFIDRIVSKVQGISRPEAQSFLIAMEKELYEVATSGKHVHLNMFWLDYSIKGYYDRGEQPNIGSVKLHIRPTPKFKTCVTNIIPILSNVDTNYSQIKDIYDIKTRSFNNFISPSYDHLITGSNIKCASYQDSQKSYISFSATKPANLVENIIKVNP